MSILTPADAEYVGLPPKPLIPQQDIVNPDGTPTLEYHSFLTTQYEWSRRLVAVLTGNPYPSPRVAPGEHKGRRNG
jgi:hypothetical protein